MSTCPEPDIWSQYVDGELSNEKRVNFEQHIQTCCKCKKGVYSYRILKQCLSCNNVPEIDLESSISKLILKKSLKNAFLPYKLFYCWNRTMFLKASAMMGLFIFACISIISIRNKMNMTDSNIQFHPIIPITHESHLPINLQELHLTNMNTSFYYAKNINAHTYRNMANTFNGFTNLYSSLEKHEMCAHYSAISPINRHAVVHYNMNMPFYRSLNKNEK